MLYLIGRLTITIQFWVSLLLTDFGLLNSWVLLEVNFLHPLKLLYYLIIINIGLIEIITIIEINYIDEIYHLLGGGGGLLPPPTGGSYLFGLIGKFGSACLALVGSTVGSDKIGSSGIY